MAGRQLGLQLHGMEIRSADKLEVAFKDAVKAHSAALAVMAGSVASANPKLTTDLRAQTSIANDIRPNRLCYEWRFDVLRT